MAATRAGLVAHSPFVESLSSTDELGFDPVYQTPTVDLNSVSPELTYGDAAFPSKLPSLVTTKINGANVSQLNLTTGQFFVPEGSTGPRGVGVMRRFTAIGGRVFYAPSSTTDVDPPTILATTATIDSGQALFSVDVDDPATARVYVLFNDGSGAQWKSLDLAKPAPASTRWSGGRPATGTNVEYIIQACDPSGNCATSSNKARYFKTAPPPAPQGIEIRLNGSESGFTFQGEVVATVVGADPAVTLRYSVDNGQAVTGSAVTVTTEGQHSVRFDGSDGSTATRSFAIDTKASDRRHPVASRSGRRHVCARCTARVRVLVPRRRLRDCVVRRNRRRCSVRSQRNRSALDSGRPHAQGRRHRSRRSHHRTQPSVHGHRSRRSDRIHPRRQDLDHQGLRPERVCPAPTDANRGDRRRRLLGRRPARDLTGRQARRSSRVAPLPRRARTARSGSSTPPAGTRRT